VPADEASGGRNDSVLSSLLAPLRLPERVLDALDELRPIRIELVRVREQTKPLDDLLPALKDLEEALSSRLDAVTEVVSALESDESHLNRTTNDLGTKVTELSDTLRPVATRMTTIESAIQELAVEVKAMSETVVGIKDDIQRTTGLRGDRGMMERARDALTGGNQEHDRLDTEAPASEGAKEEPK